MSASTPAAESELSDEAYEVLRAAVNLARYEEVRRLVDLKRRIKEMFAKTEESVIDAAIRFWANRVKETGSHLR